MQNPESNDIDYFIKTLSSIKEREVKPELIGSIITHYASIWLPESGPERALFSPELESVTASWMKKKFIVETLIGILPPEEKEFMIPCDVLLRLLRMGNMVGAEPAYLAELEKLVSRQLDRASLKELMIPSFRHTCTTLLDFELVLRLVQMFVNTGRSGAAVMKVAKLVDSYLAEAAAVDSHLRLSQFIALATAIPAHARATDDSLYRAIDTYLKAHPGVSKQERKTVCNLIDIRKLSQEASFHAAQNERLPVRAVIQVLHSNLNKHITDWSGSLSEARSPIGPNISTRIFSSFQEIEMKRLRDDVVRLQSQCMAMEKQIEKVLEKKKSSSSSSYGFSWKKFGLPVFKGNKIGEVEGEDIIGLKTPLEMRTRLVRGRRKSMS